MWMYVRIHMYTYNWGINSKEHVGKLPVSFFLLVCSNTKSCTESIVKHT